MGEDECKFSRHKKSELEKIAKNKEFFSNKNKSCRERVAVCAFLKALGVEFGEGEVQECCDAFPDVLFRDERFEVTEILDPGRKRGDEIKADEQRIQKSTCWEDELRPYQLPPRVAFKTVCEEIAKKVQEKQKYSPEIAHKINLLIYYNRRGNVVEPKTRGKPQQEESWQSVSVIGNDWVYVYSAGRNAPDFMRTKQGQFIRCTIDWPLPEPGGSS